ncbi:MAG: hypothetical protein AAF653_06095 [Chloroflexota bacterium]
MSDFDSLRDFDDDFDDFNPDDNADNVIDDGSGGERSGMTPVELLIVALFVMLNIIALVMIILIATGRIAFGAA